MELERNLRVPECSSLQSCCDEADIRLGWILRVSASPSISCTTKQSLIACNNRKTISTKGKKPQKLHHGTEREQKTCTALPLAETSLENF